MHTSPSSIQDWSSPAAVHRAAKGVQLRLAEQFASMNLPLFRLVQLGHVPSKAEIAERLLRGGYREYLK